MCECNCSQGPDFYFPGPEGITYGLELYRGCVGCGNAPGISLYRIPNDALEDFEPEDWRKEPPWYARFGAVQEYAVALVDEGIIRKAVAADEDGNLASLLDEDGEVPPDIASDVARAAWQAIIDHAFERAPEAALSSEEVSRMEPFPLVPIPPHEVERETKAFSEKFDRHEDLDGMEPYDWREAVTLGAALDHGYLPKEWHPQTWYTFKRHRALTVTDPERPGWEAFRMWALEILNGPSTPEPDPWPVYDAAAYQAERLRRASASE